MVFFKFKKWKKRINFRIYYQFSIFLIFFLFFPLFGEEKIENQKSYTLPNSLQFGAFVDSFYLYNTSKPQSKERPYTTQAVRNDEFNINLAFIDVRINEEKYRGRVAIQYGTSVNTNYAGEVSRDKSSNENSVKHIQEAYVGFKIGKDTWVDSGIYLGHIGFESWISSENWNYTRSLSSENTPYYAAGIRISHQFTDKLSFQFHVMNGWQNITEKNKDKSFGTQIKYDWSNNLILTYNTFIGNEGLDSERKQTRYYHNFMLKWNTFDWLSLATLADIGIQKNKQAFLYEPFWREWNPNFLDYRETKSESYNQWYQAGLWLKVQWVSSFRFCLRYDRMYDPKQVLVNTYTKDGFMTSAYTVTFDYLDIAPGLLRLEYVQRDSFNKIFPTSNQNLSRKEELVVFSFAVRI